MNSKLTKGYANILNISYTRNENNSKKLEKVIIKLYREDLSRYKMPKTILYCESIPKTNVGKVLRRVLVDEIQKEVVVVL